MPISVLQTNVLEFKLVGVAGESAADGHLIHLQMQGDYILPSQPGLPAFASMGVGDTSKKWHFRGPHAIVLIGNPLHRVGRATSDAPMHFGPGYGDNAAYFSLDLLLTSAQLDAIERERNGQQLSLTLKLYGDLFDGYTWRFGYDQLPIHVDRDQWVAALNNAHYGSTLVYEVPLSLAQKGSAKAIDAALKSARTHFMQGNYREAVAACRVALEPVKPDNKEIKAARDLLRDFENKKKLTKEQRQMLLLAAVEDYTQPSHHGTEEGEYLDFTRKEALLVMGATLGLLSAIDESQGPKMDVSNKENLGMGPRTD